MTAQENWLDPYAYVIHIALHLPAAQTLDDAEALPPWRLTPEAIVVA